MPLDMDGLSYHSASSISTFNRLLVGDNNVWLFKEPFDALGDFHQKWDIVDESPGESSQWEQDVVRDKNGHPILFSIGDRATSICKGDNAQLYAWRADVDLFGPHETSEFMTKAHKRLLHICLCLHKDFGNQLLLDS